MPLSHDIESMPPNVQIRICIKMGMDGKAPTLFGLQANQNLTSLIKIWTKPLFSNSDSDLKNRKWKKIYRIVKQETHIFSGFIKKTDLGCKIWLTCELVRTVRSAATKYHCIVFHVSFSFAFNRFASCEEIYGVYRE